MNSRSKYTNPLKAISWLLIAAVFALTVQPMHLHLQHVDHADTLIHDHVVDLHFVIENIDPSRHQGEAVFSATPDGLLKKLGDNPLLAAILVCLGILLLSAALAVVPRPAATRLFPGSGRIGLTPPLRAPPAP